LSGSATNIAVIVSALDTIIVIRSPIDSISKDPMSISLGRQPTLSWTSSNADTVTIDNGLGDVGPNGSIELYPARTTTYTIRAANTIEIDTDSVK